MKTFYPFIYEKIKKKEIQPIPLYIEVVPVIIEPPKREEKQTIIEYI